MSKAPRFLQRLVGGGDVQQLYPTPSAEVAAASSADGPMAREFEALESSLQVLSGLPGSFHQLVSGFQKAYKDLDETRERSRTLDAALKEERSKALDLTNQLEIRNADLERTEYSLQRAQASLSAKSQKNVQLESALSDARLAHADANAKLARLEPLVREFKTARDALTARIETLDGQKDLANKEVAELRGELIRNKEEIAKLKERANTLAGERQGLSERLDQSVNTILDLKNAIAADKEQIATLVATVKRESGVARALKKENDQVIKEREDLRAETTNQIEGARSRYRVLEKLLEESRMRFQGEAHSVSALRREKNQRDNDIVQVNLALATAREEIVDLRSQLLANSETITQAHSELTMEAEKRGKFDVELQISQEENAKLLAMIKSDKIDQENISQMHQTVTTELKATIDALRAENERIREELQAYRFADQASVDDDDNDVDAKGVVVSLKR